MTVKFLLDRELNPWRVLLRFALPLASVLKLQDEELRQVWKCLETDRKSGWERQKEGRVARFRGEATHPGESRMAS
jgi:hypothetical protein